MYGPDTFSPLTREAGLLLGRRVRLARKEHRWTIAELAERVGVSPTTIQKVEKGDLTVALGSAFEAAVLVGVPLFDEDPARRVGEAQRVEALLAVLPASVRHGPVDDAF